MRWPDLFTGTSTPSQDGQVQLTMTGDQELQEHTSAPDTSDSTPTTGENEDTTTPEIKPTTPVEVTGDFSTGTGDDEAVETIVLGDTSSEEQTTSETDTKTNTPTEVSVESPATSSQTGDETSASDPLGAVE